MADADGTLLSTLTRRAPLLERLAAEPMRACELAAELEVSRSTVDRGLRELETLDLVERREQSYRATLAGELALEEYECFADRVTDVVTARELLSALPTNAPLDPVFLDGASVVSRRPDPQRPAREFERLIDSADWQRMYVPAFLDHHVDVYRDDILDGLECEFALTSDVLDRLVTRHRQSISEGLSTGRVEFREAPESLPYTLVVARDDSRTVAMVLVFVDEGLNGIVHNDDPEAVAWAESILDDIWEAAEPLSLANG